VSRLEGLLDEPRPGAPRSITDTQVEQVSPRRWSRCRQTARTGAAGDGEENGSVADAIVRIWHAFGLQPHRVENFKFSKDPQFVEKVRDIVGCI